MAFDASTTDRHAAAELQRFLHEMSGADFALVTDAEARHPHEIWIGRNSRWDHRSAGLSSAPGAEGYHLKSGPDHLIVAGEGQRGTLYAVYALLANYWGCRWFTREISHIPRQDRLTLRAIDERGAPAFEYREPYPRNK